MTKSVDLIQIQETLYESLKPSGWSGLLKSFLLGSEFTAILEQLYELSTDGKRFTPGLKEIFKAFIECPVKDLSTILISKEPFNQINQSNGIPFDCSKEGKEHVYTRHIFDAIERTTHRNKPYDRNPALSRWSKQGILMLNTNLTVQLNKPSTHDQIWKPFTAFVLDTLNSTNQGLIFVFIGDDVKKWSPMINVKAHYKFAIPHPGTASQSKEIWDSQNIFPILSKLIHKNYKRTIVW